MFFISAFASPGRASQGSSIVNETAKESAIARLYDAVGNPDEWGSILDDIAAISGAVGATIFSGDAVQVELNHVFMSSFVRKNIGAYALNGFNRVDLESYKCVREIGKTQVFESEYELYSRAGSSGYQQPEKLDQLRDWLSTIGIEERLISVLQTSPGNWSFMGFHSGTRGWVPKGSESSILLKHVAKVVTLNRPFLLLNNRFNAVFEVIDRFNLGVIVLGNKNQIVLANKAANTMLDDADSIRKGTNNSLQGISKPVNTNLSNAIQELSSGELTSSVGFRLPRSSGKIDYVAEISWLSSKVIDSSDRYKLVVIVDPERNDIVNLSGLREIYSLSDAEEVVAEQIVVGSTNKEIAEHRNVSPETVKVQVASIFSKTNCRNRTELICLAHKVSIPVDQVIKTVNSAFTNRLTRTAEC